MKRATMDRILLTCVAVATLVFIFPITRLSFIDDEALNSYINGWIDWHHSGWWPFYLSIVRQWIVNEGRIIPLNLGSVYALFHFTHNSFAVKTVQALLIALNTVTLAVIAKRISRSWKTGLLCGACVALTLQVRFPIDPIAGFAPLLPLTLEFILVALLLQLEWQRQRRPLVLAGAAIAFTAAALCYEITILFVTMFWYLAWRRNASTRDAVVQCAAFTVPLVILVAASLALRHVAHVGGADRYALALNPLSVFRTYAIQTVAALPYTFAGFNPIRVLAMGTAALSARPAAAIGIGVAFAALIFAIARRRDDGEQRAAFILDLAAIGAMLWLLAGPMMSASPMWQHELVFGQAYLPIYFEYFGIALLAGSIVAAVVHRFDAPAIAAAAAVLVGVATAATYQYNRPAERAFLPIWTEGRFALEEAARNGLFDRVPDGAKIVLDHSYPWDFEPAEPLPNSNARYLLFMLTGKRSSVVSIDSAAQFCAGAAPRYCDLRSANVFAYYSDNERLVPGDRWTRVVRIDGALANGDGTATLLTTSGVIAARGAPLQRLDSDALLVSRRMAGDTTIATAHACSAVAANDFPDRSGVTFGPGFYNEEHNAQERFHWSKRRSQFTLIAPASVTHAHFTMLLASYVSGTKVLVSIPGRSPLTVGLTPAGAPVAFDVIAHPNVPVTITFTLEGAVFTGATDPNDTREFGFRAVDVTSTLSCSTVG
jgi:hypothetical protein